ncbi:hypothetical protein HY945_00245 [Candidatus Gottesmanbacteria bacterium]|nr:hypothetical protein [Candidatus Gottesmanbacteria bacterium]
MGKIRILILIFIVFFSAVTLRDLFKPGFFTSHDGLFHVARLYFFEEGLRDGQLPVRFAKDAYNGYGYPLFVYSYRLPYISGELFRMVGFSYTDSIKWVFLTGYILSGLLMYIFLRDRWGIYAGFVGSIVYQLAPYRFLNIFVRGALAESLTYIFPPLILLSVNRISAKSDFSWKWLIIGAFSFSALILTNMTVFILFCILFFAYTLFTVWKKGNWNFQKLGKVLLIFVFGTLLSAYYLFPAVLERGSVIYSKFINYSFLNDSLLDFDKLLYSKWGYGWMKAAEGGMSFQIGAAQWFVILSAVIFLFLPLFRKGDKLNTKEILFWMITIVISVFMMLKSSSFVWRFLSPFWSIQYAWRLLSIVVFSSAVLTAVVLGSIRFKKTKFLLGLTIITLAVVANRNHIRINQQEFWDIDQYLKVANSGDSFSEFLPVWADVPYMSEKRPLVESMDKSSIINIAVRKSNTMEFTAKLPAEDKIIINTVYFPGWEVFVDGKKIPIGYNKHGVMEIALEKGEHNIKTVFAETPLRKIADIISIVSFLFLIIGFVKRKKVNMFTLSPSKTQDKRRRVYPEEHQRRRERM